MAKKFKENFKRIEKKYLLSKQTYQQLRIGLMQHMVADDHPTSTIANLYYDTPDFRLIRDSLEKPLYKEKLRLRSYKAVPGQEDQVFLELKTKFQKVVYKRRLSTDLKTGMAYLVSQPNRLDDSQIKRELDVVKKRYSGIQPMMYIYYDRLSFKGIVDDAVRITFDSNITYRTYDLDLSKGVYGDQLLPEGQVLMEVKIPGACPIWLADLFTQLKIYPASFTKYGNAYKASKVNYSYLRIR